MAETSVASNNKSIAFRGRVENEMPSTSQAQNRFMHAAAEGKVEGVPAKVGKKFVKADKGRKIGKLPQHADKSRAKRAIKRGAISSKAAARHLSDY
jgi:hypothetical protein